jgi:hypothetical protein
MTRVGTAPWNRVLSTHRGGLLLEHHDERLADRGLDLAIGASRGAQKSRAHYCTLCCTIPYMGDDLAESLAISFDLT